MGKIKIDDKAYDAETPMGFTRAHKVFDVLGMCIEYIPYGLWLLIGFLIGYFI